MASLRRIPNSPYFIACITMPDGRRTNRSTKTTDRRLAQRLADEWQHSSDAARQGRFVESQARAVLNDILTHVGEQPLSDDTVESFLRRWLEGKGSGGTAARYSSIVSRFLDHLGGKKSANLTAIGYSDILSFVEIRQTEGIAPRTLNLELRTLGSAFTIARKLGLITHSPVERGLAIRPIAVSSCSRECFSIEEVRRLAGSASGDWKTAILLGYYTGARLGDCANMKWGNVDFVAGVISFEPQKTRRKNKRVVVPIHPVLMSHFEAVASSDRPELSLCPTLAGRPTGGKNGLSAQFNRIMATAGIDPQSECGKGKRQFARLSFHSLRHSFNSELANGGVDQEIRMKLTGHSSVAVNGGYTHLELPRLKLAVERIPSVESASH